VVHGALAPTTACGGKGRDLNWSMLVCDLSRSLCFCCSRRVASAEEQNLAELMPRFRRRRSRKALQSFKLQHGFSLEIVAADPTLSIRLIGIRRTWTNVRCRMTDYPFLPEREHNMRSAE